MYALSTVGKARLAAYAFVFLWNLVVLGLSAKVNQYQQYFFVADILPLAFSVITLVVMVIMLSIDLLSRDAITARPVPELSWVGTLVVVWLCVSSYSSSRWRNITPGLCSTIPQSGYAAEKSWCHAAVALKAFIWLEWATLFLTFALLLRYVLIHRVSHAWILTTSLSRFDKVYRPSRDSEFVQTMPVEVMVEWNKF